MKRGEIWTTSGGKDYASKPRPVVIVQDDHFDATDSVTVCLITTDPTDAPLIRIPVSPSDLNGLQKPGRICVDKVSTTPRAKLGKRIGHLDDATMLALSRALIVFLGIAE